MTGSSPLARGTRRRRHHRLHRPGLIPAHAGNTLPDSIARWWSRAHPRSHREHTKTDTTHPLRPGSSPLARGTLGALVVVGAGLRLIPARAGNTWSLRRERNSLAAHPRSRGEHCDVPRVHDGFSGSSPLARGTQSERGVGLIGWRLIPARAGNTRFSGLRDPARAAHPRSRGEHGWAAWLRLFLSGSSPLARGTRSCRYGSHQCLRLIPARAGNTR